MGDPKFSRKTYDTPSHPWQGERIKAEVEIVRAFGLKNKTEVWKAQTVLRNLRKQSRDLQARLRTGDAQAKIEADALIAKCGRLGYLTSDATLNDILTLKEEDVLSRRLQTIVYEKGLANTIKQARQMVTHGHIYMNGHRVTVPGYIVTRLEESSIEYNPASPFTDDMHPMRISAEQAAANAAMKAKAEAEAAAAEAAAAKADAEEAGITAEDGEN
ncbi:MAG: 30S ribosomal protein S4 [Candidatus Methanomethylophilaceae archaeon]|jgi:small subunit ribosomal protein S4|nr:30S ribosomal protein S4 [Thermoplasmata archaeon]MBQ3686003.1 30S ribosomal protein S4 [Candidatus Methanomethylophilaceae archaeon]